MAHFVVCPGLSVLLANCGDSKYLSPVFNT
jgi:hypothetical protein